MSIITVEQELPVTLYVDAVPPSKYNDDELKQGYGIRINSYNWGSVTDNAISICKREITITIPGGVDVLTGMVESLKAEQQKLRAEAEIKCNAIESQIQSMLCIEHNPRDQS